MFENFLFCLYVGFVSVSYVSVGNVCGLNLNWILQIVGIPTLFKMNNLFQCDIVTRSRLWQFKL